MTQNEKLQAKKEKSASVSERKLAKLLKIRARLESAMSTESLMLEPSADLAPWIRAMPKKTPKNGHRRPHFDPKTGLLVSVAYDGQMSSAPELSTVGAVNLALANVLIRLDQAHQAATLAHEAATQARKAKDGKAQSEAAKKEATLKAAISEATSEVKSV